MLRAARGEHVGELLRLVGDDRAVDDELVRKAVAFSARTYVAYLAHLGRQSNEHLDALAQLREAPVAYP